MATVRTMFGNLLIRNLCYPPPQPPALDVGQVYDFSAPTFYKPDLWLMNVNSASMTRIMAAGNLPPYDGSPPMSPNQITRADEFTQEVGETNEHVGIELTLDDGDKFKRENERYVEVEGEALSSLHVQSGNVQGKEVICTPAPASILTNPSPLNSTKELPKSQTQSTKSATVKSETNASNIVGTPIVGTPIVAHENHAIKRHKLNGGKTNLVSKSSDFCPSATKTRTNKEDKKMYVRDQAAQPFVSMAEMTRKFESGSRESHTSSSSDQIQAGNVKTEAKLTPARPKTPELKTTQSFLSVKTKNSAELEEELMTKNPKFKARPVNKKILEASTLPPLQRCTPQPPESKEFHSEAMERANHNAAKSTAAKSPIVRTKVKKEELENIPQLKEKGKPLARNTTPNPFLLRTEERGARKEKKLAEELLQIQLEDERARIPKAQPYPYSTDYAVIPAKPEPKPCTKTKPFHLESLLRHEESKKREMERRRRMEMEEAEMKRFKALPILIEYDFHLETRARANHNAEKSPLVRTKVKKEELENTPQLKEKEKQKPLARNTTPNPFLLHTEERGAWKEKKLAEELLQKQVEDERARIPKAQPYPYSTDYAVIPAKPEPKPCTKTEPFQLKSLSRHGEEKKREMEERRRMEMEEAEMKRFKALPILIEDPIPLPVRERKPLTKVEEFNLHLEQRAIDRSKFDENVKEKEKRYREAVPAKMQRGAWKDKRLSERCILHSQPLIHRELCSALIVGN